MGSLMRSEEMKFCQMLLQSETAYNCISELGELGLCQFRDVNPNVNAFQRKFVNEIRRCDEMERKLRYLEKEIRKDGIEILMIGDPPEAPQPREMIDLEATFEKLENELKEVNANAEALKKTFLELTELKHILKQTQQFFDEVDQMQMHDTSMGDDNIHLLGDEGLRAGGQGPLKLGFVAGVILRERIPGFERMLWRTCHGNVFLKQASIDTPLEDPYTGDNVYKSVFIIFFQGEQLQTKVKKICEGFRATLYPCPERVTDRREMITGVMSRIEDLNTVLSQTQEHRYRVLMAAAKNVRNWFIKVRKIKAIYYILNICNLDVTTKCLIAECWVPTSDFERVCQAVHNGCSRSGSTIPPVISPMEPKETPPTYNRTNKVTSGFQNIVDSYGVATYREINPTPFTIITFPFLFAVMFGDAGHGLLMAVFAAWMVLKERNLQLQKNPNEIWLMFFNGRYMILLMGLFSIYTGLMYNDIFSKSINIFGSSWKVNKIKNLKDPYISLDPENKTSTYLFGIDPVWQLASNKILFLNSYKMKLSVIMGVAQMFFGVLLSYFNHRFFAKQLNVLCEFIPQVIFMLSIFGYMNLLIFVKWMKYDHSTASDAPSILINMINMFLMKYVDEDDKTQPIYLKTWYSGQRFFQTILLLSALMCVPWMLAIKPYLLKKQNDLKLRYHPPGDQIIAQTNGETVAVQMENGPAKSSGGGHHGGGGSHDETFDMGEIVVHQAIHTIEYCLGAISHTASYLRLWALSLAHAQLSEVLWSMVFRIGLQGEGISGGIFMFVVFAFWASLTVSVLLVMEGLSAFLHALRLHWIEFQSKFYTGTGYAFSPFSFKEILLNPTESGDTIYN
ncbi:V-type ATPase subunit a family protein Vha100-1 isoform X1 [Dermatophagoides farinae]|uniref:V-type ATPase subunit a family protein Vha100-1 isoform X1 n=1 Tax=Dermatophagoides farinae TaxID=6954 RepID=UPI003F632C17